ncbi:MAG TPA: serine hydrolase [candidate division Zixibacteria bacterium]|nr:serine hydrolase [candidate division Zixibacteria bacterium]
MKKAVKITLAIAIPLIVTSSVVGILVNQYYINNNTRRLDQAILSIMDEYMVPGLAVSAITDSEIVWMNSYGYSNIEENIVVTENTLFMLGSISKSVISTAFMQLVEEELVELDSNINAYLPFNICHPLYTNSSITPRMLLTHTSGITDNGYVIYPKLTIGTDSPICLAEFIFNYLNENGSYFYYSNFNSEQPGTYYDYSNVGSTLVAYLIEVISNSTFEQYCQENIFLPLGMENTSWFLSNLDVNDIAVPYEESYGYLYPITHYSSPVYPCGFLRTSVLQFSYFLMAIINDGQYGEIELLHNSSVNLLTTIQLPAIAPNTGLFWQSDGEYWGHGGSAPGVSTLMLFHPIRNEGVIVFTNGENTEVTSIILNEIFSMVW